MSAWPLLRESRTVHAGSAPGTVVRCGLTDATLADLPVSVVLFFEQAPDEDRLAAGLARALERLPVFAGRLRTRGEVLEIVCEDAGVPMDSYQVDETLSEAMGRVTLAGSGYVDHVEATAARQGGHPLLTVRLSRLNDGALALGCSWHHAVGDVQSFALLMRTWSAAVEGTELPEPGLVEDRDAYLDGVLPAEDCGRPSFRLPEPAELAELAREFTVAPRANRTVQVYFTEAEIARMRERFTTATGQRLSTNDVLCAHTVNTVRVLDEDQQARHLTMPVNLRRALDLPAEVVGNLLGEVYLRCAPAGAPEQLAVEIRAAVNDFARSQLSLRSNRTFLESIGHARLRDCVPLGFDPARRTFTFSNWSGFGLYEITFDGLSPVLFSPAATLQLPWVAWLVEGFERTGKLLTIVLPAKLAGRLRTEAGQAALHPFREPQDELPKLAQTMRKLA